MTTTTATTGAMRDLLVILQGERPVAAILQGERLAAAILQGAPLARPLVERLGSPQGAPLARPQGAPLAEVPKVARRASCKVAQAESTLEALVA